MMTLVTKMTSLLDRFSLQSARKIFDWLRKFPQIKLRNDLITEIDAIVNSELSADFNIYVSELCDHRYENTRSLLFMRYRKYCGINAVKT